MNARFTISMGVAIVALGVGFYLLNDIQQETPTQDTQISLDESLSESNQRLAIVKDEFYNGKYNGDLPKDEVITIIQNEISIQEELLEKYKNLSSDEKTDKTIDMRFFQLGKYSWAGEKSMLKALESQ